MALANDLLLQAEHLVALDERRPKQADLRRGTSAAYYALFHLLVAAAVRQLLPAPPSGLRGRVGRAFNHSEMKQVCRSIMDRNPSQAILSLAPQGFSREIVFVARAFVALQEARHSADYDLMADLPQREALRHIQLASDAFAAFGSVRRTDGATVFLAALLLARRWSR